MVPMRFGMGEPKVGSGEVRAGPTARSRTRAAPVQVAQVKPRLAKAVRSQPQRTEEPGVTTKKKAKGAKGHSGSSHAGPRSLGLRLEIGFRPEASCISPRRGTPKPRRPRPAAW